jgi:hypothetical protein
MISMNAEPRVNVSVEDRMLRLTNDVFAAIVDPTMAHVFIRPLRLLAQVLFTRSELLVSRHDPVARHLALRRFG